MGANAITNLSFTVDDHLRQRAESTLHQIHVYIASCTPVVAVPNSLIQGQQVVHATPIGEVIAAPALPVAVATDT